MYKTISINNNTYQQLHALSVKLNKPKSQIIHDLIIEYSERLNEYEKNSLKTFNISVKRLAKKIKISRGLIPDQNINDLVFDMSLQPEINIKEKPALKLKNTKKSGQLATK